MLSTSHTLSCPTCGHQATIRLHTVRHRRKTQVDAFEPQITFTCRNRCVLSVDAIRELLGEDAIAS